MSSEEYVMMSQWFMDIAVRLRDAAVVDKNTADDVWDKIFKFQHLAMSSARRAFAGD